MICIDKRTIGGAQRAMIRHNVGLVGAAAIVASMALVGAPAAAAFFQLPDAASPESGTAQVVAQGVASIGGGDLRWQVSERTAPPPANASPETSELGFVLVDSGVLLVEDLDSGEQHRLPAGEAMMAEQGVSQNRAALGSDNAVYYDLSLVNADDATDGALFSSDPFPGSDDRHDVDLLQDVLAPGGALTIPAGALPTLVLITDGDAQVTTEAGDVIALGAKQAIALPGSVVVTAGEQGTALSAAYAGPAVPRLGEAAPRARTIATPESAAQAAPVATPAVIETEPPSASAVDEDGDGLSTRQEARENTDPALADTDEDGLTDGEEVLTIGTAPLAPDTDGDGVLDGDEVAQGTDPLTVGGTAEVAAEPTAETAIETEAAAPEETIEPAAPAATSGDSDGDGLEDEIEFQLGTDPNDPDTDDDGATDGDEYYVHATGTRNPDSDGDGVLDGDEVANGTNPNDITSN